MFKLSDNQIRTMMVISIVGGFFLGVPFDYLMVRLVGSWILYPLLGLSIPFLILNVYWLIQPQAYTRFLDKYVGWWERRLEKVLS